MTVDINLYNYNFINNISFYIIIINHLMKSDFNAFKNIFLNKTGIDNFIRLIFNINKYINKINSINKSKDYK